MYFMSDMGDSSTDRDEEDSSDPDEEEITDSNVVDDHESESLQDIDLEREPNQAFVRDYRMESGRNSLILPPHELQRVLTEGHAQQLSPVSLRTTPPQTPQQESSPPLSIQLSNLSIINSGLPPLSQLLTQNTITRNQVRQGPLRLSADLLSGSNHSRRPLSYGPVLEEAMALQMVQLVKKLLDR